MRIVFYNPHTDEEIGEWTRDGDGITATESTQSILDAARARGDSDDEAWEFYSSWSNGYSASLLDTGN